MKAGYASPIRTPRGRDVMAACGQLRSLSVKLKKYDRKNKILFPNRTSTCINC